MELVPILGIVLLFGIVFIHFRRTDHKLSNSWLATEIPSGWSYLRQGLRFFWLPGGTNRYITLLKGDQSIHIERLRRLKSDERPDPKTALQTDIEDMKQQMPNDQVIEWKPLKVIEKIHALSGSKVPMAQVTYESKGQVKNKKTTIHSKDTRTIVCTPHGVFRVLYSAPAKGSYDKNRSAFDRFLKEIVWNEASWGLSQSLRAFGLVLLLVFVAAVLFTIYDFTFLR